MAATPAARCATRRRGTTWSGSGRRSASSPGSGRATRGCRSARRVRWVAPSTTSPCCSACSASPTTAIRCRSSVDLPTEIVPPDRPLRVAWSADFGLPIEPAQLAVLAGARAAMVGLGWAVVDATPDLAAASDSFRVLRAWNIANGPTAAFGDRRDEIKATIQDEIRRGEACSQADVAAAYAGYNDCWRRTAAFFDDGYDLLACPVTQVAPFPVEWEYPTEIAGVALANYIDWMAACWRITMTGCPAMSLPAGFDADGMPVGVQLVARQGRTSTCCGPPRRSRRRPGSPPADRRSSTRCDRTAPGSCRRPRRAPSPSSTRPARGRSPRSTTTRSASPAPCPSPTATGSPSCATPGHDLVVAVLACWHAGAIAVPLHPPNPDRRAGLRARRQRGRRDRRVGGAPRRRRPPRRGGRHRRRRRRRPRRSSTATRRASIARR